MRPRVFPAEDSKAAKMPLHVTRFNEAAGIPRGRLYLPAMMPSAGPSFNEAAVFPAEDFTQMLLSVVE